MKGISLIEIDQGDVVYQCNYCGAYKLNSSSVEHYAACTGKECPEEYFETEEDEGNGSA